MNLMDTLKASGFGASYEFGFMSIAVSVFKRQVFGEKVFLWKLLIDGIPG